MIINAKFKGRDGLLNYRKGKTYWLQLCIMNVGLLRSRYVVLPVFGEEGKPLSIPYREQADFLQDWENINQPFIKKKRPLDRLWE